MIMIYDIAKAGTYSKTFDESKYQDLDDWLDKVEKQRFKLTYGFFKDPAGRLYRAEFKKYDLSKREDDGIMTVFINRIIKFKWFYVPV